MNYLPSLLGAIAVLVGGVIVAWIIARLVRATLKKFGLHKRIVSSDDGSQPSHPGYSEKAIGRIVFLVLLTFVLAGFFQVLRLPGITDPLISMLQTIFSYIPRLVAALALAALALAALAWVVAAGLRALIVNSLGRTKFDNRVDEVLGEPLETDAESATTNHVSLSRHLGDLGYWLVFLLFLPLVLDTLGLQGLLAPVQDMLNKILVFLPNLFVGVLILIVGYFAAKIVSRIVTNLLQAAGVNRLTGVKEGTDQAGQLQLAAFIGYVVFVLILVPIVIASLQALQLEAITRPAEEMLKSFLLALPNIFAAAALLVIAYYVGRLLAKLIDGLLSSSGFDGLVSRMGLSLGAKSKEQTPTTSAAGRSPSWAIGQVVLVVVMLLSAEAALRLIEFQGLADLLNQVLAFLGLVVFGAGLYLAALAARLIRGSDLRHADILAPLAQTVTVILIGAMGLEQMGIGRDIIRIAFGLTLGAVAVAAAIAFGIGSRDVARSVVTKYLGHWGKEKGHDD